MTYRLFDTVVLDRELPENRLLQRRPTGRRARSEPNGLEVEFVTASGKTQALFTLNLNDVRAVQDSDVIAVRSVA